MHREGNRLVREPIEKKSLLQVLQTLEPLLEEFPDVDEDLPPLREIDLQGVPLSAPLSALIPSLSRERERAGVSDCRCVKRHGRTTRGPVELWR